MKFTISKKAIILFVVLFAVLAAFISYYFVTYHKNSLLKEFDERAKILLSSLVLSSEYPVLIEDKKALNRLGANVLRQKDVVFCGIQDKEGRVLFQRGAKGGQYLRQYSSPIITERFSEVSGAEWILGEAEKELKEIGYVYLILSIEDVMRKLQTIGMNIGAFVLAGIVISFLLFSLFIRFILGRPIRNLMQGIEKISQGDLLYKVQVNTTDEIGTLARAFNKMTDDLNQTTVSRNYIDNILKSMGDALIVVNAQGLVTRVNDAALNMLGYDQEEILFQSLAKIFTEESMFIFEEMKAKEEINSREAYYQNKEGNKIAVLFSSSLMQEQGVDKFSIVCTARDITAHKQAEDELLRYTRQVEQINKDLDNFTHIISHDLKEPLRSLYAFSKFIVDDYRDKLSEDGQACLGRIMVNATRMQKIVENLLYISNIEKKRNPFEKVKVSSIIEEIKLRLEYIRKESGLEIIIRDALPELVCDRLRIQEAFFQLINNAVKFCDKEKSIVEIGCKKRGLFYEFYVRDNGLGIDRKYFDKIFVVFQRLGKREDNEGTGAGLTIVKKIIEMHYGKIWVDSVVGKGTTVYFTIPEKQEEASG
ncbi:MAG: PAS domain S-box protein [PVC group bacterium]|nr:PAS domain S-box protein [PVC group bacterium]